MKTMLEVLSDHPFLQGMNDSHLRILADAALFTEFKRNEIIFCEGDLANRFYLLQSGTVALEFNGKESGTIRIQELHSDEALGWSWMCSPCYWHFDARALEPVKAISFYGARLREQAAKDPVFGHELIKRIAGVLIQRLQMTRVQLRRKTNAWPEFLSESPE